MTAVRFGDVFFSRDKREIEKRLVSARIPWRDGRERQSYEPRMIVSDHLLGGKKKADCFGLMTGHLYHRGIDITRLTSTEFCDSDGSRWPPDYDVMPWTAWTLMQPEITAIFREAMKAGGVLL